MCSVLNHTKSNQHSLKVIKEENAPSVFTDHDMTIINLSFFFINVSLMSNTKSVNAGNAFK